MRHHHSCTTFKMLAPSLGLGHALSRLSVYCFALTVLLCGRRYDRDGLVPAYGYGGQMPQTGMARAAGGCRSEGLTGGVTDSESP